MGEKEVAPHSTILAWKIPWTEEPGRLQSMGSRRVHTTEWLHFHFSLSCIGEGNGNPLQCSCLENPRDRGAWWAAVYEVTQNRTRLKWLSSSSSSSNDYHKSAQIWFIFVEYHLGYYVETKLRCQDQKQEYQPGGHFNYPSNNAGGLEVVEESGVSGGDKAGNLAWLQIGSEGSGHKVLSPTHPMTTLSVGGWHGLGDMLESLQGVVAESL